MNPPNPQAAPSPPPPAAARRPEFFVQLDRFWHRVTEGLELSQLWKQFSADARSSYRLYHRDFQARAPQEARQRGFWHTAQEFVWAILEKLTPARRVLLLSGSFASDISCGRVQLSREIGRSRDRRIRPSILGWGRALRSADARSRGSRGHETRPRDRARYSEMAAAGEATPSARPGNRFRHSPGEYRRRRFL